jgi:RimJ/RimL family protein N-acetyltransferase
MSGQPILTTTRLELRPFAPSDATDVRTLAGTREVAETTLNVPHPYPEGAAEVWIATHPAHFAQGTAVVFAITRHADRRLIGAVGLQIAREHDRAELGYWIGVPWWNQGYASEAAAEVIRFGFATLALRRIEAHHFSRNPASGRVMVKCGMRHDGRRAQAVKKWGRYEDLECYGIVDPVAVG